MAAPQTVCYIVRMPFSPFDPDTRFERRRRFRQIPVRTLVPNLITLLALCAGLTAIRFAVEGQLEWAVPAGAITALLPIYVYFLGVPRVAPLAFVYTLGIAFLMVSRLPVFSGKRVGKRVAPEMVLPVFVLVVLFFALLISYPWPVLAI